ALHIELPGEHQVRNAALAAATVAWLRNLGRLDVTDDALRAGLESARIAGRLERLRDRPLLLLDAAHNPDGARALRRALETLYLAAHPTRRLILVLGLSEAHQPAQI